MLGPGDTFGLPLNGENGPDQDRVSAREDSTVYFVERGDLKRLAMATKLIKRHDGVQPSPPGTQTKPGTGAPS